MLDEHLTKKLKQILFKKSPSKEELDLCLKVKVIQIIVTNQTLSGLVFEAIYQSVVMNSIKCGQKIMYTCTKWVR